MTPLDRDRRVVMTLDAGGTNFVFSAVQGRRVVVEAATLPSHGDDLDRCLKTVTEGFTQVKRALGRTKPVAISFAFPGPADYRSGVIGPLANLPGFRGGVALGPMLEDEFELPVFINNDGDLFTLGEALGGFLPFVNGLLERAGSTKRYRNLLGVTLGTGFGAGLVGDGRLWQGDNGAGAEIFLMRNRTVPETFVEDSVSIRAVKRSYALGARLLRGDAPEPHDIFAIAEGRRAGHRDAAVKAFERLAMAAADAIANALTLVDGLVVVGGGLSGAHRYLLPVIVRELNGTFERLSGERHPRLLQQVYDVEDASSREAFLQETSEQVRVPNGDRTVAWEARKRTAVGISRLGTNEAVALGAYAFAVQELDRRKRAR